MPEAVIVDAIRTPDRARGQGVAEGRPRGRPRRRAAEGARRAQPGRRLLRDRRHHDGLRLPVGEAGYNVGRNAALLAGLDHHVPATTVNRFCASSLQTIRMAFHAIKAGEGDQYIAAGVEAVSRFPPHAPFDPHPQLDGSEGAPYNVYIPMGLTAENVAERCKRLARGAGRVGRALAGPRGRRARPGHFDAEIVAGRPTAEVRATTARARARRWRSSPSSSRRSSPRRHRHGRQRLPAQRRRRRGARDVRGEGARRSA